MKQGLELQESRGDTPTDGAVLTVPVNDSRRRVSGERRSVFPPDAVAHIFQPSRSVTTSGPARSKGWRLVFERRTKPFIEPLMGYTGSADTLPQIELAFATLESAVAYAERQGLTYVVQGAPQTAEQSLQTAGVPTAEIDYPEADLVLTRLGWWALHCQAKGIAANPRFDAALLEPEVVYAAPADVVADALLTVDDKRAVLKNWAWNEYLVDLATAEGMPENRRPSRLDEVGVALLALEPEPMAAGSGRMPARVAA
ncbi:NADH dehydrogenase ubiquinone Fe-S protein 4 [Mesorhizobium sp. B4-1-3]|uniref:NADH dehydrogenase ubiquinone Fe-S protein 4 n=1 Tax=Mesorhizobium sp. B4-1-3 TaxID=2589889 RepID=UPI001FEEB384|nr:NADH dehydrogenase ubiquinone Fe-S protein 4 [Mesorhizobium sp. B4-1-3]